MSFPSGDDPGFGGIRLSDAFGGSGGPDNGCLFGCLAVVGLLIAAAVFWAIGVFP